MLTIRNLLMAATVVLLLACCCEGGETFKAVTDTIQMCGDAVVGAIIWVCQLIFCIVALYILTPIFLTLIFLGVLGCK